MLGRFRNCHCLSSIRVILVLVGASLPFTQLKAELVPLGENAGRAGRQPNASYRSDGTGPLPLVANFVEESTPRDSSAEDSFALLARILDGNPEKPDYRRDAGFAIHISCEDGSKTALLRRGLFVVHGLDASAANVDRARRKLQDRGLYGPIEIHAFDGTRLPYIDNLANLIVSDGQQVSPAEIDRVLAPDGIALIDGRAFRKERPDGIDDWTHYLYDAAGSGASRDRKFEIPNRMQWHGGPLWAGDHDNDSTLDAMVAANGRVFSILGESKFQVPHKDIVIPYYLTAHDAFNGVILWKRKLDRWGWQQWKTHYAFFNNSPLQLPRSTACRRIRRTQFPTRGRARKIIRQERSRRFRPRSGQRR